MPQKNLRGWSWILAETGIVVAGILIAFSLNSDGVLQQLQGEGAGGVRGVTTAWNHALLDDPVFQEHLALRHLAEQQVAEVYRALAEQARVVLERIERARS